MNISSDLRRPLPRPEDPWNTRTGFLWYNDEEIFHDSAKDLDRKVNTIAERGINHVITYSCTHFRWSFLRYWDVITAALTLVVIACHRYGIHITEHHSAHLTINPQNPDEDKWMEHLLSVQKSSLRSWPHLRADCDADPIVIDGVRLSEMRQIDGRTGKWTRSPYRGWCMCFNNLHYRKAYFNYLATQYQTGIDGIMTDDVQWYGDGHSCACPVCRELFRQKTGYELPPPGEEWNHWFGNRDNPSYLAWLKFRVRSIEDFHNAVKHHYEGLGLRPLRPNYCSSMLHWHNSAYCCEHCPDLDWISNEFCDYDVIRYSWPAWAGIAAQCFALARVRGIPAGGYVYPDRKDTILFTWALLRSWGMIWSPLYEGVALDDTSLAMEHRLRAFDRQHAKLFRKPEKIARLGLYDSWSNREFYAKHNKRTVAFMTAWMNACYRCNLPFDIFEQEELSNRIGVYRVVILSEIALLSDAELSIFKSFVEQGGTLVWIGLTGTRDDNGTPRSNEFLTSFWGIEGLVCGVDGVKAGTYRVGQGRLVVMPFDIPKEAVSDILYAPRKYWVGKDPIFRTDMVTVRKTFDKITSIISGLFEGELDMVVENAPPDLIATAFYLPEAGHLVLHLVNATGTFDVPQGSVMRHGDVIPFPVMASKPALRIRVKKSKQSMKHAFSNADYLDPLKPDSVSLTMTDEKEMIKVEIPSTLIRDYGLVDIV